jgi:hypothetical protein
MYSYIFYHMFFLMLLRPNTEFFARYTISGDDPLSVEAYSTRSSLITYFPRSSRPIATGKLTPLKEQCHKIFECFFDKSVSPEPLSILLRSFRIFSKILNIFAAQGVVATAGGKWENPPSEKFLLFCLDTFGK